MINIYQQFINMVGEQLRAYRKANDLSQERMAAIIGVPRSRYQKWEDGVAQPKYEDQLKIDKILSGIVEESKALYLTNSGSPIYDTEVTAGEFDFNGDMPERIIGYISLPNFKACKAFVYVRGDSMYGELKAGDLIGIIPVTDTDIIQYGNIYLIVTNDDQRMVKYIRRGQDDNHLILRSKNKNYDDIHLHRSKVRRLFMVKGPIRDEWQ